jgi:hypothetical protein
MGEGGVMVAPPSFAYPEGNVMTDTLLPYAIAAVQRGFHIFPVEINGKTPLTMIDGYRIKWGAAATNELARVASWWRQYPMANIGIAASPSGLLVVDCDEGIDVRGRKKQGIQQYTDLAIKYSGHPSLSWQAFDTYSVRTGGGGLHLYFKWPANVQASQAGLDVDVDIRSNGGIRGGYVLSHGSITEKGRYEAEDDDVPIADVPSWLQQICTDRPKPQPIRNTTYAHPTSGDYSGMAAGLRLTTEGNRSNRLLWSARQMCSDGADIEKAYEVLVPAATDTGLAERDVRATIKSGYNLQTAKGS